MPPGYGDRSVGPSAAFFDPTLAEFLLPYGAVRSSGRADSLLLEFLQSTYEAAADLGGWDRQILER